MIKFILSFICGYILHMAVKPKTDKMSGGWPNLTEQTMGMIGVFPFFWMWWKALRNAKDLDRLLAAFFLAALGFGLGDAAGYFFEKPSK